MSLLRTLVEKSCEIAIGLALLLLVLLEASMVVLRYGFATGVPWAGEVAVLLMMTMAWCGLPLLWLKGGHIAVDMLGARGEAWRKRLPLVLDLGMLPATAVLMWATWRAIEAFSFMDMAVLPVAQSIKLWPIMIGAVLLALTLVIRLADHGQRLRGLS
jgi:TRAP-type C4-dicarboxylate transport system permease small subunit